MLKRHEERRLYDRAVMAYTEWLPALRATKARVPTCHAHDNSLGALLLAYCAGEELGFLERGIDHPHERTLDASTDLEVFERAGAFLRTLHDLPLADQGTTTERRRLWEASVARYMAQADTALDAPTVEWARGVLLEDLRTEGARIEDQPLLCTHADFTPRNWILAPDGRGLTIIDWERARIAPWMEDVHALHARFFRHAPERAAAFWSGYGYTPSQDRIRLLDMFFLRNAIGGVLWAHAHEDHAFEALCRREVQRLQRAWPDA